MPLVQPSRRAVLGAAAWSVPVVSLVAATPAYASSQLSACVEARWTMRFDGGGWNELTPVALTGGHKSMVGAAELVAPVTGGSFGEAFTHEALTLTATAVFSGEVQSASHSSAGDNIGVSVVNPGGLGQKGLLIMQSYTVNPSTASDYQEVHFQFSRLVSNLSFTITDIDNENGAYQDHVTLSPEPASFVAQTNILGDGASDALRRDPAFEKVDNNKSGGNVTVSYDEAQTIILRFWNGVGTRNGNHNGAHGIFVTGFTFEANTCAEA